MVTSQHEASHRIFQERPDLLAPVFRILGVPLPENADVEILSADVTEIRPLERRVDTVLRVGRPGGERLMLAIEAQGKRAEEKVVSWAYYLSYLKAKYKCPALLLVVCQDKATADWAAGPFRLGPDGWAALSLHPLVVGPGNLPMITDEEEAAQDLTLATFSAMAHGRHQEAPAILEALARALETVDKEVFSYYSDMLEIALGDETPAQETWRNLMSSRTIFPGRGTAVETLYLEGKAEGRAEERAQNVLRVLDKRGILVQNVTRERITNCTDLSTLGRWLDRAFSVDSAEEIFAEES
ncbi:hypothetical protein [Streptomyces abikoensis]